LQSKPKAYTGTFVTDRSLGHSFLLLNLGLLVGISCFLLSSKHHHIVVNPAAAQALGGHCHRSPWILGARHSRSAGLGQAAGPLHAIGFKNNEGRRPGLTHYDQDHREEVEVARAHHQREDLDSRASKGDLVHLRHPENQSVGWRYVLKTTEDWVKNQQKWPVDIEKREKGKEEKQKRGSTKRRARALVKMGKKKSAKKKKKKKKKKKTEGQRRGQHRADTRAQERSFGERALIHVHFHLEINDGKKRSP
jgi:hypothetical protein